MVRLKLAPSTVLYVRDAGLCLKRLMHGVREKGKEPNWRACEVGDAIDTLAERLSSCPDTGTVIACDRLWFTLLHWCFARNRDEPTTTWAAQMWPTVVALADPVRLLTYVIEPPEVAIG